MSIDFAPWTKATGDLKPGPQAVFLDVLNLVKDGQMHLVHGADYRDGKPCLVNAVGQMLTTGGGRGIPSEHFNQVVSAFDTLNAAFLKAGVNKDGYVSELAADLLIRNFGEVKPMVVSDAPTDGHYVEPSDAAMREFIADMVAPAPDVVATSDSPEAEFARSFVENPTSDLGRGGH